MTNTHRTRRRPWAVAAALVVAIVPAVSAAQSAAAPPAGWEWRPVSPVVGALRVLIIYDMEGLGDIDRPAMTTCADPTAYAAGQDRLVADVNAVVEGLAAAGVGTIDVIDRHGSGCDETTRGGVLYDAATLDEMWPRSRPFGAHRWVDAIWLQTDVR